MLSNIILACKHIALKSAEELRQQFEGVPMLWKLYGAYLVLAFCTIIVKSMLDAHPLWMKV